MLLKIVWDFPGIRDRRRHAAAIVLVLAMLLSAAPRARADPAPEQRAPAQAPPGAVDVKMPDTVVHQDTTGGSNQALRDLCGAEGGGFAAAWMDQRDGMIGLYLRRFDASGEPVGPEQPVQDCESGRSLDPIVALAPDGSGAVAWTSLRQSAFPRAWVKFFDAKGRATCPPRVLAATPPAAVKDQAARRQQATRPTLVRRRGGGYAMAWVERGKVRLVEADAAGTWRDRPGTVNADGSEAEPGVKIGVGRGGGLLCAWKSGEQCFATAIGGGPDPSRPGSTGSVRTCGSGELSRVLSDPSGGFLALFRLADGFEVRHLSAAGDVDRPAIRPLDPGAIGADLAVWHEGFAVLESGQDGSVRVRMSTLDERPLSEPVTVVAPSIYPGVEQARIASNGTRLFVAWTDRRGGDPDVYGRILDPAAPPEACLGAERKLNSDVASADQIHPAIASSGARGIVAWQDARDVEPRVYARLLGSPGGFAGDEFEVPRTPDGDAPAPPAPRMHPEVAMGNAGGFLVAWIEGRADASTVRAQVFSSEGRPSRAAIRLRDAGQAPSRIAVAALPGDRGFLAAFDRPDERAIDIARITADGALASEHRRISQDSPSVVSDPALCVLDGDQALAAWSRQSADKTWTISTRFLDLDGKPSGDEGTIEPTPRKMDWDPSIAPGIDGGFVMAWTAGTRGEAVRGEQWRDVVARSFDARGLPNGPLLPISSEPGEQDFPHAARLAGGSWAVVWEDDLTGRDQTYLRRIQKDGSKLGPAVRINGLDTLCVIDRQAPVMAPLGDGVAAAWNDRSRSKGWDICTKTLGSHFDDVRRR